MELRTNMDSVPEFAREHQLGKLARRGDILTTEGDYEADTELVDRLEDAEVILSDTGKTRTVKAWGSEHEEKLHRPIFDVDFPVAAIPSTTPGHFHLYIDKEMSWADYHHLLGALEAVGIIEKGYREASAARQFTSVRLPWVKKQPEPPQPDAAPVQPAPELRGDF